MIELFLNEFLSTFPFHILACVPFHKRLRNSPWKTFLWVCGFELGYLLLFMFLSEPHMAKVTCFSAVLNGKTKYRRIRQ